MHTRLSIILVRSVDPATELFIHLERRQVVVVGRHFDELEAVIVLDVEKGFAEQGQSAQLKPLRGGQENGVVLTDRVMTAFVFDIAAALFISKDDEVYDVVLFELL